MVVLVGDQESMFPPRVANRLRALRRETPELTQVRQRLYPREHRNFAGVVTRSHWPRAEGLKVDLGPSSVVQVRLALLDACSRASCWKRRQGRRSSVASAQRRLG